MKSYQRASLAVACSAVLAVGLAACSNSERDSQQSEQPSATATTSTTASDAQHDQALSLDNGYVRAMEEGKHMTAIFGTLTNHSDKPVHVVGFSSSVNAKENQLHEVVDGVMRQKQDGFLIPAHESLQLEPGKEHLMLMGVDQPVVAGDTITVVLQTEDGASIEVPDVPVRTIAAGDEKYSGGMEHEGHDGAAASESGSMSMEHDHGDHSGHEGHDHDGHDHDGHEGH